MVLDIELFVYERILYFFFYGIGGFWIIVGMVNLMFFFEVISRLELILSF